MLTVEYLTTPPEGFLDGAGEGRDFYAAYSAAGMENFTLGYFAVRRDDRIVTVAPCFLTLYSADTLVENRRLKPLFGWIGFHVACIGHPSADLGYIDGEVSADVLAALNVELLKRAPVAAYVNFSEPLPLPHTFSRVASLPVAVLDVSSDYFEKLGRGARRDLKRKLRKAAAVRLDECTGYPRQHAETIYALYLNIYGKADMQFERVTPQFFERMGDCGRYLLYWDGDDLIGFTLLVCREDTVYAKYMGLDLERGRRRGLYFRMFMDAINVCIRDGYSKLQTGQSAYDFKRRIGSRMIPNWISFSARNRLLHPLLALLMWLTAYRE
jgi:hypothetical protein